MTRKYYISAAIATPILSLLVATSRLPALLALLAGGITMLALVMAGFYIGLREKK